MVIDDYNHDGPWSQWREAAEGSRMHHAWIFAGNKGLGKKVFAIAAARELVAQEDIPQPTGDHPDIIILSHLPRDKAEEKKRDEGKAFEVKRNISVDQIRFMQQRLTTRPTFGSKRVVVIDPADDLERSASNALLKSLEEPPKGTHFVLISHRPQRLLATIRSRCRLLRFPGLSEQELIDKLSNTNSHEVSSLAARFSGGSLGAARDFIKMDLEPVANLMAKLVSNGDSNMTLRAELIAAVGPRPSRERIQYIFTIACSILSALVGDAKGICRTKIIEAHSELVNLQLEAPTYNYDNSFLIAQIASLLAGTKIASEPSHV